MSADIEALFFEIQNTFNDCKEPLFCLIFSASTLFVILLTDFSGLAELFFKVENLMCNFLEKKGEQIAVR